MGQHGSTWVVVVVPPGACNILITCQTSGLLYSTPNHPLREFCHSPTHSLTTCTRPEVHIPLLCPDDTTTYHFAPSVIV